MAGGRPVSDASAFEHAGNRSGGVALGGVGAVALIGTNILLFIGLFSMAPALPALQADFAQTPHVALLVQIVGAVAGLTFALGSATLGGTITRFGYRGAYIVSLLAFSAAGAGAAVLHNLYAIILTRAVVGVATAGILNAGLVALGQLVAQSARGRILGIQALIGGISAIVLFPVIGQLVVVDWRLAFGVHLAALLYVPLVLALPRAGKADARNGGNHPGRGSVGPVILTSAGFAGMVIFISTVYGPLLLAGLGVTDGGLLSIPPTAASIGSAAGSTAYVFLHPRLGLSGTFTAALAFMAVGLVISGSSTSVWPLAAGAMLMSFGGGAFAPNLNATAIALAPLNPGQALGTANGVLYGAMILFPFISTTLSAVLGGPGIALLGYAVAAGALALLFLLRRGRLHGAPVIVGPK